MNNLPSLINSIESVSEIYLNLKKVHPTKTYNYGKRKYFNVPVIEIEQFGAKCRQGESWLYFAIPSTANLKHLEKEDRLYIGAQTQDRMFRGDGCTGGNYHHGEMRAGNGDDNLINFIKSGNEVSIYRTPAQKIEYLISNDNKLKSLKILLTQPRTPKKHLAWWFEQYVLFSEHSHWRWNTAQADKSLLKLFCTLQS